MGWEDFSNNTQFVAGMGNGCCGDQPLKQTFPRLYGIATTTDRETSVESLLTRLGAEERRSWDVRFIQDFNDW